MDPTLEDETEGNGNLTFVFKDENNLCTTHKSGGQYVSPEKLEHLITISKNRANVLRQMIIKES